jgi:hypothetical protein
MSWFFIALWAPFLLACSNHNDKFLLSRYLKKKSIGSNWRWHQRALELGCHRSNRRAETSALLNDSSGSGPMVKTATGRGSRVERVRPAQLFTMARGPQKSHRSAERKDPSTRPSFPCPLWPICCNPANASKRQPASAPIRVIHSTGRSPLGDLTYARGTGALLCKNLTKARCWVNRARS